MQKRLFTGIFTLYVISMFTIYSGKSSAQSTSVNPTLSNVVQLSAQGSIEVQQDVLTITMNTTKENADPALLQAQLKATIDAALTETKKVALSNRMNVRTGQFNISPRYDKNGRMNGWLGHVELILEGSDFELIASTAGKIQSLTVANVNFGLSRDQRTLAESKAQSIAINRFKSKATEISNSFGFSSYTLREVAINAGDQIFTPRPRLMAMEMKMASADSIVPIEAGKNTIVVNVSGSIQLN